MRNVRILGFFCALSALSPSFMMFSKDSKKVGEGIKRVVKSESVKKSGKLANVKSSCSKKFQLFSPGARKSLIAAGTAGVVMSGSFGLLVGWLDYVKNSSTTKADWEDMKVDWEGIKSSCLKRARSLSPKMKNVLMMALAAPFVWLAIGRDNARASRRDLFGLAAARYDLLTLTLAIAPIYGMSALLDHTATKNSEGA